MSEMQQAEQVTIPAIPVVESLMNIITKPPQNYLL
jgi:hypothetical protein